MLTKQTAYFGLKRTPARPVIQWYNAGQFSRRRCHSGCKIVAQTRYAIVTVGQQVRVLCEECARKVQ